MDAQGFRRHHGLLKGKAVATIARQISTTGQLGEPIAAITEGDNPGKHRCNMLQWSRALQRRNLQVDAREKAVVASKNARK